MRECEYAHGLLDPRATGGGLWTQRSSFSPACLSKCWSTWALHLCFRQGVDVWTNFLCCFKGSRFMLWIQLFQWNHGCVFLRLIYKSSRLKGQCCSCAASSRIQQAFHQLTDDLIENPAEFFYAKCRLIIHMLPTWMIHFNLHTKCIKSLHLESDLSCQICNHSRWLFKL